MIQKQTFFTQELFEKQSDGRLVFVDRPLRPAFDLLTVTNKNEITVYARDYVYDENGVHIGSGFPEKLATDGIWL